MNRIKTRLLTGWTFRRALFLGAGIFLLVQFFLDPEWPGIVFGSYFTAMGIFGFGCAGGNCSINR